MLQEILEVFGEIVQQDSRIVTDSYSLKDGTYRLIEMNNQDGWKIKETIDIFYDKKLKQTNGSQNTNYTYIQELDYYSKLLDMNKPIDPKKVIHSCHYFALSVKKESVLSGKLNKDIIKKYYAILKNPMCKYEKKPNSKKLYENVEKEIGPVDKKIIESIEEYERQAEQLLKKYNLLLEKIEAAKKLEKDVEKANIDLENRDLGE